MAPSKSWSLRPATPGDRPLISALFADAAFNHQHLDWFRVDELLGVQPFDLLLERGLPVACLACPPDSPPVAWVRLFASRAHVDALRAWEALWEAAREQLSAMGVRVAAALSTGPWLDTLLLRSGFEPCNEVIFLEWRQGESLPEREAHIAIRPLRQEDLPAVVHLDHSAFDVLWRYSLRALRQALRQASEARVIEVEGEIVAYQITTASALGAHLARIAVRPDHQMRGYGRALLIDTLRNHLRRGFRSMSVNTQADNERSLVLYHRMGFQETGERFPIFQVDL